jgi:hypothetical protein
MAILEFVISPIKINKDNKIFINLINLIVVGHTIVLSNSNVTHLSKICFVYYNEI